MASLRGHFSFSPTGWFNMSCNCVKSSENSAATIWTPHMPMFQSKQLSTKTGVLWKGFGPKKPLLGPGCCKRDPICGIKHIKLTNQHNSSRWGSLGLLGHLQDQLGSFIGLKRGLLGQYRALLWPDKRF